MVWIIEVLPFHFILDLNPESPNSWKSDSGSGLRARFKTPLYDSAFYWIWIWIRNLRKAENLTPFLVQNHKFITSSSWLPEERDGVWVASALHLSDLLPRPVVVELRGADEGEVDACRGLISRISWGWDRIWNPFWQICQEFSCKSEVSPGPFENLPLEQQILYRHIQPLEGHVLIQCILYYHFNDWFLKKCRSNGRFLRNAVL